MCGIIAQIGKTGCIDRQTSGLMHLTHRGPDTEGVWHSPTGRVWLGHRRLSIVDLNETGRQPMHNEDHMIWLVCNGEIYNYPSLRNRLEALGHRFYSQCDNEVILHAYEEWDTKCVDHLEGMFAFAVWDEQRQRLLAARDRIGIKPFYYAETGQGLLLASEAGALLPLLKSRPEPEPMALAYVMTLGYVPSPWSIWRGIFKLEPGHFFIWQQKTGLQFKKYWEPPRRIESSAKNDHSGWRSLFETVLKEHLLSDVPIALFLSGGLDSSAIAVGLHRINRPVRAITAAYPDSPQNEAPVAAAITAHLNFSHTIIPFHIEDVNGLIRKTAAAFDEPQGYSALLSMYLISNRAARDFKVVLAGDGGDELFGGYNWYQDINGSLRKSSQWIRRCLRPLVSRNASPNVRQKAASLFAQTSFLHRHAWRLYPRFLPEETETLLSPMGIRFGDDDLLAPLKKHFEPALPLKRALQRVDLMTFCSDSILAKVDRASMANSLEVRVPFLDHRIIEWALSQPIDAREEGEGKPTLREYIRPFVPLKVMNHPKQGFSLRVLDKFNWGEALNCIGQSIWVQEGYWSSHWERLLEMGVPYRTARIWNLLMLTQWADAWFRKEKRGTYA